MDAAMIAILIGSGGFFGTLTAFLLPIILKKMDKKEKKSEEQEQKEKEEKQRRKEFEEKEEQKRMELEAKIDKAVNGIRLMMFDKLKFVGEAHIKNNGINIDDYIHYRAMYDSFHEDLDGNGDSEYLMNKIIDLPPLIQAIHINSGVLMDQKKPTIFVVDDDQISLEVVYHALKSTYSLNLIKNPHEIFNHLKRRKPNMIIADYCMPEMDGLQLIEKIKSISDYKDIPIIMLTGETNSDVLGKAISLGVCEFINKPYESKDIQEKVALHII